jgi:DNA-binding winged helix-turn-helix (wHTH) protein
MQGRFAPAATLPAQQAAGGGLVVMKTDAVIDLVLGRDLLSVTYPDGSRLHFTRQERTLLLKLTANPGRLITRATLAAALGGESAEQVGERHVDFLINRLRSKLGDAARAPRYIRTHYGEGYSWVGPALPADKDSPLLRIGTVYGRNLPGAAEIVERLDGVLQAQLAGGIGVAGARFFLDASFHDDGANLRAALVLRDGVTSAIIDTFRLAGTAGDEAVICSAAEGVIRSIWAHAALPRATAHPPPNEPPPWVKLFEGALMMNGDLQTWKSSEQRLAVMLSEEPGNPAMEVMRSLNLYLWLIQSFRDPSGKIVDEAQWRAVEDEIETIALANLSRFQEHPVMQLAVAKLLLFINRGYLHLSRRIAEDLLVNSSAHAAAFALAGEAAGFAGDFEAGTVMINRALELSEAGSQFQVYLLVVEACTLFAAGDMAGVERIYRLTRDLSPSAFATLQSFLCLEGYEEAPVFCRVIAPGPERAREALRYIWNCTGRRFAYRTHRRAFMAPLANALIRRFGPQVVPPEVALGTGLGRALAGANQA